MDHHYHRDERLAVRLALVLIILAGVLALVLSRNLVPEVDRVSEVEVWNYIEETSLQQGLDPEFVYALAWAESSLNAKARSLAARGMMQVTKPAWREVSDESYRQAWDWRTNVRVAIDYLVFCRDFLNRHDSFTYPLLAASYRYGPYYVQDRDFDLSKLKKPRNEIYKHIFNGNIRPVSPPVMSNY